MRSLLRAKLSEPPEEREVFMSADEPREPGALDELGFMLDLEQLEKLKGLVDRLDRIRIEERAERSAMASQSRFKTAIPCVREVGAELEDPRLEPTCFALELILGFGQHLVEGVDGRFDLLKRALGLALR